MQLTSAWSRWAFSTATLLLSTSTTLLADEWPQYRGPERNGISREKGWKVTGARENLWKKNVGLGYSAVVIANGRLYTQGFDAEGEHDIVFCLDPQTGEELWSYAHPAKIWNRMHGGGTLTTPSVDGKRVYVIDREGIFLCLDAETGVEIWKQDVKERFQAEPPTWGFSASPLVLEDKLILNLGKTYALNKETGEVIWEAADTGHAYSTPVDFSLTGTPALAVFNGKGLAVFAQADGKQHYFQEWKAMYDINAASPVVVDGKLFISSSYSRGSALLDPSSQEKPVVMESKSMRNQMSGCVLWNDHLYGFDQTKLTCIDLAGNEKWRERSIGNGALILADGKLLVMSAEGELIVAEASPEQFRELSRADVLDGGVYWTTPTLVGGLIYCRSSLGEIVCRDHRGEGAQ